MKLIPKEIKLPKLNKGDGIVRVKLFVASATWWITEYEPSTKTAFGFVSLGDPVNAELGYIDITELEELKVMGIFKVERDLYYHEEKLDDVINNVKSGLFT